MIAVNLPMMPINEPVCRGMSSVTFDGEKRLQLHGMSCRQGWFLQQA